MQANESGEKPDITQLAMFVAAIEVNTLKIYHTFDYSLQQKVDSCCKQI